MFRRRYTIGEDQRKTNYGFVCLVTPPKQITLPTWGPPPPDYLDKDY